MKNKNIIELAQSRGSTAKTKTGARRWLLERLPKPDRNYDHLDDPSGPIGRPIRRRCELNLNLENLEKAHRREVWQWRQLGMLCVDCQDRLAHAAGRCIDCSRSYFDLDRIEQSLKLNWPLRQSQSSWAGGDHFVSISIVGPGFAPSASGESKKAWSKNGKWSGTDSYARLRVSQAALHLFPTLRLPDGAVVIDAEKLGVRSYRVIYLEQGQGFNLKAAPGFYIRGHLIKGKDYKRALVTANRARNKAAAQAWRKRRNKQAGLAGLATIWVSVADSLKAGNCVPVTEQVAAQIRRELGGDVAAVRADFLLSIRDDSYVRRAIDIAAAR